MCNTAFPLPQRFHESNLMLRYGTLPISLSLSPDKQRDLVLSQAMAISFHVIRNIILIMSQPFDALLITRVVHTRTTNTVLKSTQWTVFTGTVLV